MLLKADTPFYELKLRGWGGGGSGGMDRWGGE